jgi:hypothetical protein
MSTRVNALPAAACGALMGIPAAARMIRARRRRRMADTVTQNAAVPAPRSAAAAGARR